MYFNEQLQKELPSGKPKYILNGKEMVFENYGESSNGYDINLAQEFASMRGKLKNSAWQMEYGNGGYYNFKWVRDESGNLVLPDELKNYGVENLDVQEMEESEYDLEVIWDNANSSPVFKVKVDRESNKFILVPVRTREQPYALATA